MRLSAYSWPLALGSFISLSACNGASAPAPVSGDPASASPAMQVTSGQPPRNQCNAEGAQSLVGQPYTASTLDQARAAAGADEARMLRPDTMVTKEYKVGRLNVVVGADNRVSRIHCG